VCTTQKKIQKKRKQTKNDKRAKKKRTHADFVAALIDRVPQRAGAGSACYR
jgi:hypothetical protein